MFFSSSSSSPALPHVDPLFIPTQKLAATTVEIETKKVVLLTQGTPLLLVISNSCP